MEELRARSNALDERRRELQEELQEAWHTKKEAQEESNKVEESWWGTRMEGQEQEEEQQSRTSSFSSCFTVMRAAGVKMPLGPSSVAAEVVGGEEEVQQRGRKKSPHKEVEEVSC